MGILSTEKQLRKALEAGDEKEASELLYNLALEMCDPKPRLSDEQRIRLKIAARDALRDNSWRIDILRKAIFGYLTLLCPPPK